MCVQRHTMMGVYISIAAVTPWAPLAPWIAAQLRPVQQPVQQPVQPSL